MAESHDARSARGYRTHRDLMPRDLCPALMMKQILVQGLDDRIWDDGRRYPGDGYYWCQRTCTPVGPDDELVDVETCRADRACWEGLGAGPDLAGAARPT